MCVLRLIGEVRAFCRGWRAYLLGVAKISVPLVREYRRARQISLPSAVTDGAGCPSFGNTLSAAATQKWRWDEAGKFLGAQGNLFVAKSQSLVAFSKRWRANRD